MTSPHQHDDAACDDGEVPLPPAYAALLTDIAAHVADLVGGHADTPAVALVLREGKIVQPVAGMFADDKVKDHFAEMVRQVASRHQADAIALISEVWTLGEGDREHYARERAKYPSLADHPRRIEAAMVKLETYDGQWLGTAEIIAGTPRTLGPWKWRRGAGGPGRFSCMLPVKYATAADIAAFRERLKARFATVGLDIDEPVTPSGRSLWGDLAPRLRDAPAAKLADDSTLDDIVSLYAVLMAKFMRERRRPATDGQPQAGDSDE